MLARDPRLTRRLRRAIPYRAAVDSSPKLNRQKPRLWGLLLPPKKRRTRSASTSAERLGCRRTTLGRCQDLRRCRRMHHALHTEKIKSGEPLKPLKPRINDRNRSWAVNPELASDDRPLMKHRHPRMDEFLFEPTYTGLGATRHRAGRGHGGPNNRIGASPDHLRNNSRSDSSILMPLLRPSRSHAQQGVAVKPGSVRPYHVTGVE